MRIVMHGMILGALLSPWLSYAQNESSRCTDISGSYAATSTVFHFSPDANDEWNKRESISIQNLIPFPTPRQKVHHIKITMNHGAEGFYLSLMNIENQEIEIPFKNQKTIYFKVDCMGKKWTGGQGKITGGADGTTFEGYGANRYFLNDQRDLVIEVETDYQVSHFFGFFAKNEKTASTATFKRLND